MERQSKCLIVDDHPIFREGIRDLVIEEGLCHVVAEAASAEETSLAAVRREPWDLLILDVALPDNSWPRRESYQRDQTPPSASPGSHAEFVS